MLGSKFGHASRNRAKYKDVSFSREDILAKVTSDFAESERAFVIEQLAGCGKTFRSSFESLRTNGAAVEYAKAFRSC
jgi:hypothetical protein